MFKNDTRSKILKAATDVVLSDGILHLTIEAAAVQAGVSKGGLLYHFPSKDALVAGMVKYIMQNYIDNIEQNAEQDILQYGKWTRSFIKGTFEQSNPDKHMDAALMAAATINPDLLKPIQDAYKQWQDHIEDDNGLDPINATIFRLAVDGLWFSEIFDLAPLEDDHRQRVLERLIQLTKKE